MPNTALMVASSDEHFREMVRDNLLNIPNAKVATEYQEIAANLYIRVLQELERSPSAGLIVDISGDPEGAIKAIERVKQAAPDLFVIASHFHADGETVIACMRAGANEFLLQPIKRTDFRDAIARLERAPRHAVALCVAFGTSTSGTLAWYSCSCWRKLAAARTSSASSAPAARKNCGISVPGGSWVM